MHFSGLDNFFWAVGFVLHLTLLSILLWRRRSAQFPVLTLWIAFMVLRTIVLFITSRLYSTYWYGLIYHVGLWIDFVLQLGLAFEIVRIVLRPTGTWVRDARAYFLAGGLAGAALAAVIAWEVSPPASSVGLTWRIRGNLFTSLVICGLFVLVSLTANRFGLGWRNHVMAVGQGLTAWSAAMVVTTALQSFLGAQHYYNALDQARSFAYVTAITWMIVQLWIPEPERQPIAPDLQEYILALHERVEYDLRRLDARH